MTDEVEVLDIAGSVQFLRTEALFATGDKIQCFLAVARILEQMENKIGQAYCIAACFHSESARMSDADVMRCLDYLSIDTYDDQFNVIITPPSGAEGLMCEAA